ncbi:MAG: hypothetical protein RL088_3932 [Verrucomicrobiota bacterium]|jgi:PIN domain nuclease of toxin-antitoxin system
MKLLLDVHAFVWWDANDPKLSRKALAAMLSPDNSLHFSLANVWEMQIKMQLGKMELRMPLDDLLRDHESRNGLLIDPISRADILALSSLPPHHRDPFDRILIAQAKRGGYQLVTCDPEIAKYDVEVLW